MDIEEGFED